jgi:Leucine-rich repeat (LRR) protein
MLMGHSWLEIVTRQSNSLLELNRVPTMSRIIGFVLIVAFAAAATSIGVQVAVAETPPDELAAIKAMRGWASNIQKNRDGTVRFVRFSKTLVSDKHVANVAAFKQLDYLAVVSPDVTDVGLKSVENLTNLDTLFLSQTKLTNAGMKSLAKLSKLEQLYVDLTQVSDDGLAVLANLKALKLVSLNGLKITDDGLRHLESLPNLETLSLSNTQITDAGLKRIAKLKTLKNLLVDGTKVTDAGVSVLANLPDLESLDLSNTSVTGSTLSSLKLLKKLKRIQLLHTKVTAEIVLANKSVLPRTVISITPQGAASTNAFQRYLAKSNNRDKTPLVGNTSRLSPLSAVKPPAKTRFATTDEVPDFQRHVIPLLGRLGCNGRNCHGSFQGQGGFRLSMFGYDFEEDHKALTGGDSPRVDSSEPQQSLMLLKPTMQEEHEGGLRFKKGSWQHSVLSKWITFGAKGVAKEHAHLVQLRVDPAEIVFQKAGEKTQLQAIAVWSDGTQEDVTGLTRFRTNNDSVATVDPDGMITCVGPGDTYIVSFYDNGVFSTQAMLPVSDRVGEKFPAVPTPTIVDELVVQKLRKMGIVPSEISGDEEFLRRVSLDISGTLPTVDEVTKFIADTDPKKRAQKIDQLLESTAFIEWWTNLFSDLTGSNAQHLGSTDMNSPAAGQWRQWIRRRVQDNVGWDKVVAGILLAESRRPGQTYEEFAAEQSTYLRRKNPEDFNAHDNPMHYYWFRSNISIPSDKALSFGYVFLGVRLQCAQCHKHPFDQWSKKDFEQFTEFFTRIKTGVAPDAYEANKRLRMKLGVPIKLDTAALRRQMYMRVAAEGLPIPWHEVYFDPPRQKPHVAKVLGGQTIDLNEYHDPREPLMEWLSRRDNPYFAKAFVNRIWAHYFGTGIVDPPDDFNMANPPSNKALLEHLANEFIEHEYDVKWLHREITNSRTYQLSWRPTESNRKDKRNFSHSQIRRMPAEVTIDAILQATASDKTILAAEKLIAKRKIAQHPRSIQSTSIDYSLLVFGKPLRTTNCDCERQMQPTLLQSLYVRNDHELLGWLERTDGWLIQLSNQLHQSLAVETDTRKPAKPNPKKPDPVEVTPEQSDKMITTAYLRTLSREPKTWERERARKHLSSAENSVEGMRDLLWVLLNTQEFLTNH